MRVNIILKLIKKEIIEVIRDKKTLLSMIIIPLFLYPLLLIGVTMFSQVVESDSVLSPAIVYFEGDIPDSFIEYIDSNDYQTVEFYSSTPTDKHIDYHLLFQEDGTIYIEYNSSELSASFTINDFSTFFTNFQIYQLEHSLLESDVVYSVITPNDVSYEDTATNTQTIEMLLSQILPMLLLVGVVLGVIYPAIDIVTGERERNTLETLLSLPLSSLEIVASKFIAIAIAGVVSTLLNVLSLSLSIWYLITGLLVNADTPSTFSINIEQLLLPLLITAICLVTFSFFVSAITMIVVSMTKSFKEAQNYCTPLMLVILLPSYITMVPSISLDPITSFIPIVNISLGVKALFTANTDYLLISFVILSNLLYSSLAVVLLSKIFTSENILFSSKHNFKLLQSRSNRPFIGTPGIGDGIILFSGGLVAILYLSTVVTMFTSDTHIILFSTQCIIALIPLLYSLYIKCDFKETFSLKYFHYKYILLGIPLVLISLFGVVIIQNILISIIPSLQTFVENFSNMISFDSLYIQVFLVAIMPAICEELFFRGFLLKAFNVDKHPFTIILITSILFGIYHMNILQFFTGLLLGSVLGFITYKSKSIYPAIILHFMNNFIAILIS